MALPKRVVWPILTVLVIWDVYLTVQAGGEGNPLWRPLTLSYGINILWLLIPVALFIFYLVGKVVGSIIERTEHEPKGEEIVLTSLLLAYATYVIYITLISYRIVHTYLGFRTHYALIPLLVVPVLIYQVYLEYTKKKRIRSKS